MTHTFDAKMNRQLELERHVALNEIERRQRIIDALVTALEEVRATMLAPAAAYEPVINKIDAALAMARGTPNGRAND